MQLHRVLYPRATARRGLLLIILAATLWGTVGVTSKAIYHIADTNALSIGFLRLALSVPPLLLASWSVLGRSALHIARRDFGWMVLIGCAMALYQVTFFAAIPKVGVTITVLVTICAAPVIVAFLAWVVLANA